MVKLIYSAIASLDGYVEDADGRFDWARPDDELHAFVNDLERPIGTHLYGRRMYETMVYWETVATGPDQAAVIREFAEIWQAAEKIVYSRTLERASSARTRIERELDPEAVRQMKEAAGSDITIGGAELAGEAIRARLVEESTCFSYRCSWGPANAPCRPVCAPSFSWWARDALEAASFTCTTAFERRRGMGVDFKRWRSCR
jgi:dihydrofolate reductase